jgi:hypothetical protein
MPVAGAIICVVTIIIAVASTGGTSAAISQAVREADRKATVTNQEPVASPGLRKQPPSTTLITSTPAGPAQANPTPQQSLEEPWASAESPVKQGDVQIRLMSAKVGKVMIKDSFGGDTSPSKDVLVTITVEVTNLSQTKKLDYRSWAGGDFVLERDFGTLADNFGNSYKRITFGMDKPVGRVTRDSIYPAKSITDVLVFESPIEKSEYLRMELPAKNFDGTGMIRFQIPQTMITRQPN